MTQLIDETRTAGGYVTTAIRIPTDALSAARRMAIERAERNGGRVSVSGVLADLIRRATSLPSKPANPA